MSLTFEWNEEKADKNLKKHSVSFEEAQTVFADISACIFNDEWHSSMGEYRELIIGHSQSNRILLVCFTESKKNSIRIISARKATKQEIKNMKETIPSKDDMLSEYDLDYSKAKTNRFAKDYHISITLDPDVASVFKTSEAVNKALRALLSAIPSKSDSIKDFA